MVLRWQLGDGSLVHCAKETSPYLLVKCDVIAGYLPLIQRQMAQLNIMVIVTEENLSTL